MPLPEMLRELMLPLTDAASLMLLVLASIVMTGGLALLQSPVLFFIGLILLVFITSAFMKYSTRLLAARAAGLAIPAADMSVFDYFRDTWALYPWLAYVLITVAGVAVWRTFGDAAGLLFVLCVGPLVPAALAAAAVTRRFLSQFNVPGLVRIARLIGRDYAHLLAAWVALSVLSAWLREVAPAPVAVLAGCIQTLAVFNLTGAVLFRHREALDLPVRREPRDVRIAEAEAASIGRARRSALDHAYGLISRGNTVGGLQHVRTYLDGEDNGEAAWEWFLAAVRDWDSPTAWLSLARDYLGELRRRDERGRAVALLTECLAECPAFRPRAADADFAVRVLIEHDRRELAAAIGG